MEAPSDPSFNFDDKAPCRPALASLSSKTVECWPGIASALTEPSLLSPTRQTDLYLRQAREPAFRSAGLRIRQQLPFTETLPTAFSLLRKPRPQSMSRRFYSCMSVSGDLHRETNSVTGDSPFQ